MNVSDFHFDLPDELIARYPLKQRSASRLLTLDGATGQTGHLSFTDLPDLLQPGDLLVFNNTRVIPARLFGQKESSGRARNSVPCPVIEIPQAGTAGAAGRWRRPAHDWAGRCAVPFCVRGRRADSGPARAHRSHAFAALYGAE